MKALILAGGKGTRLQPVTQFMPKQLIMLNGRPMIHYIIDHCKKNGINDFIICISDNSLKEHFHNALGDGTYLGANILYSCGPESLNTAGRIVYAKDFIKDEESFIVYYGDIITNFNLREMIDFHKKQSSRNNCICTLAMSNSTNIEVGVGLIDETSKISSFIEKPKISEISNGLVNVGIAVCNQQILKYCGKRADLFGDVIPRIIKQGEIVYSYVIGEPFFDIGTFSGIEKTLKMIRKREISTLP